jgi:hypothetical protein
MPKINKTAEDSAGAVAKADQNLRELSQPQERFAPIKRIQEKIYFLGRLHFLFYFSHYFFPGHLPFHFFGGRLPFFWRLSSIFLEVVFHFFIFLRSSPIFFIFLRLSSI